ncbi:MAG: radical SAM protein [Elusimicrobia bacterium]|nr:radical SAM protein [Elusimicrobiota bacterium]
MNLTYKIKDMKIEQRKLPALSYQYKDALYLNITPRCPTACSFCIKFSWEYMYRNYNLLLPKEPSVEEVLATIQNPERYSEIVFCGYGESSYRLLEMERISLYLKQHGAKKIRLNTIGLGNLINGRDISQELAGFLDVVSISLNTLDPEEWKKVHRPLPEFKEKGFESVLEFIRACAKKIPETFVTAVEMGVQDKEKFENFVLKLGAKARFRPFLDEYESK